MNECIYCKSTEIESGLPIVAREYGNSPVYVGPYFLIETKKFLGQQQNHCKIERMYADICKKCGGIKFYIKEVDKDWQKEVPSIKPPVIWHT